MYKLNVQLKYVLIFITAKTRQSVSNMQIQHLLSSDTIYSIAYPIFSQKLVKLLTKEHLIICTLFNEKARTNAVTESNI